MNETVEAKLGLLEFKKAPQSHIHIKDSSPASPCATRCPEKTCARVCPAKVYEWDEGRKAVLVAYENCIECGACRMLCPFDNIDCDWPPGGFGVKYRYG
jgi:ferredoxin like protein